jgi:hypothetical protein
MRLMQASMTNEDVLALMRERIASAGSLNKWAAQIGLSAPYVSDVLNGKREPGESIAKVFGLRKEVGRTIQFVPVEEAENG